MGGLRDLQLSARRVLPVSCLSVRFSRSGGPGGQNVNKVATKVDLRVDLGAAEEWLSDWAMKKIRAKLKNRINADGELYVHSERYRTRGKNLDDAVSRLESLLQAALKIEKPRKATKRSKGSQERRLQAKRRRAGVKKNRGSVRDWG